jgi:hypothetical protein
MTTTDEGILPFGILTMVPEFGSNGCGTAGSVVAAAVVTTIGMIVTAPSPSAARRRTAVRRRGG